MRCNGLRGRGAVVSPLARAAMRRERTVGWRGELTTRLRSKSLRRSGVVVSLVARVALSRRGNLEQWGDGLRRGAVVNRLVRAAMHRKGSVGWRIRLSVRLRCEGLQRGGAAVSYVARAALNRGGNTERGIGGERWRGAVVSRLARAAMRHRGDGWCSGSHIRLRYNGLRRNGTVVPQVTVAALGRSGEVRRQLEGAHLRACPLRGVPMIRPRRVRRRGRVTGMGQGRRREPCGWKWSRSWR